MKVAVVVVSIGERPWWHIAQRWLERYCRRWNHDLIVVREPLVISVRPEEFDRFQNFGRAQKLGIGRFFESYDRIIQMDDTCIVSPATPDLSQIVPEEAVGCWVAGKYFRGNSFDAYAKEHSIIYERATPLPKERFYNSGMVVYSRQHAGLFDAPTIPWEKIKADRKFPTQGYLSHQCEVSNFSLLDLGPRFNLIGSQVVRVGDISQTIDSIYVFHLTSALLGGREGYAVEIDRLFRKRFGD